MSDTGRPIRFLVTIVGSWVAMRAFFLWPTAADTVVNAPLAIPKVVTATPSAASAARPQSRPYVAEIAIPAPRHVHGIKLASWPALVETSAMVADAAPPADPAGETTTLPGLPAPAAPDRFSGSAWMILRPGSNPGASFGASQLGGSQAGIRLARSLDRQGRLAAYGRFSTPIDASGKEIALGLEWHLPGTPVRLVAEQRFGLDHNPGGPAVGIVGGFGPQPIGNGLKVESYFQAGAIARHRIEGFADGALAVRGTLAGNEHTHLDLGLSAWGAKQIGAGRLDLGPSATIDLPVEDRHFRLGLDWRQRVAGDARPPSGPAISLGADF